MGGDSTKSRVRSEPQISPLRVLRIGFINFFFSLEGLLEIRLPSRLIWWKFDFL
jgi:hypothetical protein